MKRRLTIARSLINEPTVLLLDEPTTGLDPQARHLLWDRLYRLKQRGVTLVLTTHYMDEAEQLCDRLVVMDKAKIVAEGSPRALIEQYSTREVTELRFAPGVAETLDGQLDGIAERIEHLPDRVLLYADDGEAAAVAVHERGLAPGDRPGPPVVARGRLPAADRPLADRLGAAMTALAHPRSTVGRVFEHRLLQYRRTFRASIFTSFLSPVLFLTAMGIGLGGYVDRTGAALGGVPYLAFLAPGPAGRDGDAVGVVRGDLPDHGRPDLEPDLPRDVRDADLAARHRARQPRLDRGPADADRDDLHDRHRRCSGRPSRR